MKNVRLFPALIVILCGFGCNRNSEEQKSKATIEEKPIIEEKQEIIKQEKSNSYAFVQKAEKNEISEVKSIHKNRKLYTEKNEKLSKPEPDLKEVETIISGDIYDVYKSFEKPFQNFTFLPQKDTVLIGIEGTTLKINANSFVTESTNQPVSGPIQIKLKEYYSIADMLLANLSTKAGKEMLETGGMVYLEAFSDNERLKLKTANSIEIGFPYKEKKEGMQLFNGKREKNIIEWTPADTSLNSIFISVDEMPIFPGGEVEMHKYLSDKLDYPSKAIRKGDQGFVVLSFVVQKDGNLTDLTVLKSVSKELDDEALRVVKQMPKWAPAKKDNEKVATRFVLPVRFHIDGAEDRLKMLLTNGNKINDKEFAEKFEKLYQDSLQTANLNSMSLYLLSTSNLGWINCDRFYDKKPKINFAIQSNSANQQDVKIIFHKIKSILPGVALNGNFIFQNVPQNEKITILALKTENNKHYLAVRETNTSDVLQTELIYSEITMERLKEEMQKLNKLN